jgi:hypothetical protein
VGLTLYVIQPFSRDESGTLNWDSPAWSKDRSFAVILTRSLSKRKAGVIAVSISIDSSGQRSHELEVLGSYGRVPTAFFCDDLAGSLVRAPSTRQMMPAVTRSA